MDDNQNSDICRVCRCEATSDKPLYHPCICTGSIRYIHQDCLVQWLRYSEKEFCELCNYRFSFIPIYSPDMPKRLPIRDIFNALLKSAGTAARYFFQYALVAIAWLGIIPLTAYRIYMFLLNGSFDRILNFTFEIYKTDNLFTDGFYGGCVVMCTLCTFVFLLWLREQIIRVGAPEWLERPINLGLLERLLRDDVGDQLNAVAGDIDDDGELPAHGNNNNEENNDEDEEEDEEDDLDEEEDILDDEEDDLFNANLDEEVDQNNENGDDVDNEVPNDNQLVVAQDWNPVIEWDRGPEDLTWKKILGLDGTFAFLENVFWVITLNTLFILIFVYCPYHIGNVFFKKLNSENAVVSAQFDRFITIFIGYLMIGIMFFVLHTLSSLTRFSRLQRFFGFCYITVKVALLVTLEIGLFPIVIGWLLDVCSLPIFNTTLQNRIDNFYSSPATSLFFHWLSGMMSIFYFVTFILLVKEVVRPGVLWFVRNLNDPNYNPVNEMIHLSVISHLQRCVVSLFIFGSTIVFMLLIPVQFIQALFPDFLSSSYNNISHDLLFAEFIIDLIILKVALPPLINQNPNNQMRQSFKFCIRSWCKLVAYIINIKNYLLGDNDDADNADELDNENQDELADETSQNIPRPKFFAFRVFMLIAAFWFSLFFFGVFALTVPIIYGRNMLQRIGIYFGEIRMSVISTVSFGIGGLIELFRLCNTLWNGFPQGLAFLKKIYEWILIFFRLTISTLLISLIPLLIGILFDLVVLMPIRVPLNQTPILYLMQDWVFGLLLSNVLCPIIMMTDLRLREHLELIYNNELANINTLSILFELVLPNLSMIGLILALPYVTANSVLPLFGASLELQTFVNRRIHTVLFVIALTFFLIKYHINKFTSLYEHIRNDKYLVGRRLINYESSRSNR